MPTRDSPPIPATHGPRGTIAFTLRGVRAAGKGEARRGEGTSLVKTGDVLGIDVRQGGRDHEEAAAAAVGGD